VKVLVVASNKGGTGKTTMSCALAESLSKVAKVALLDADVTGPDVTTVLGISGTHAKFDLDHFYPITISDTMQVFSPAMIIPDEVGITWSGDLRGEMVRELMERIIWDGDPEYLIIDSPPSTADELLTVLLRSDPAGVVIVTLGAETSINDAKRLIAVLESDVFNIPLIGYIRNMTDVFGIKELEGVELLGDVLMGMPRGVDHIRDRILERLEELA